MVNLPPAGALTLAKKENGLEKEEFQQRQNIHPAHKWNGACHHDTNGCWSNYLLGGFLHSRVVGDNFYGLAGAFNSGFCLGNEVFGDVS